MTEFGVLNLDDVANEATRLDNNGEGNFLDQFVPMPDVKPGQTGTVSVRILPPMKGGKLFQYNRVHTVNNRKLHCPRPLINGKWDRNVNCPICEYYASLWKNIDKLTKFGKIEEAEALKEEARELKPVERFYYNAIVRQVVIDGQTLKNVGPRILSVGKILHQMIIRAIMGEDGDPDSKLGNITDPKAGYDFIIRKEVTAGEGFPKYERSGFARSPSPLGTPEEIGKWQTSLHDLTKLRNPKDLESLEKELAIHRGLIPDETESFDTDNFDAKWRTDEAPAKTTVSVPRTASAEATKPAPPVEAPEPVRETSKPKIEDAPVEDEAFLREIEAMEG